MLSMLRLQAAMAAALLSVITAPAAAQEQDAVASLAAQDLRLAQISDRILAANAPLCRSLMPLTGMILHTSDQYSVPSAEWFGNGDVAIAQVVPGSPAEQAGALANDVIVTINGQATAALEWEEGRPHRDTVIAFLERQDAAAPLLLTLRRAGEEQQVVMQPATGCASLVEILAENGNTARSDGRVIQVSYGLALRLTDDELAVIFAHELAHTIMEHRRRLEEAGVRKGGIAGQFGRNRRYSYQAEEEADRLSVHLLANAGYNPAIAPAFWETGEGVELDSGLFRSRIYQSRRTRVQTLRAEISGHLADGASIESADRLLRWRDVPMGEAPGDGD